MLQTILNQCCSHGLRAIEGLHPQEPVFLRLGLKGVDNVRPELQEEFDLEDLEESLIL